MFRVVEQSERYSDMVEFLKNIINECFDDFSMDGQE